MSRVFSILGYFEADSIDDAFGRLARHFTSLHIDGGDAEGVLGSRSRMYVQAIPDDEVVDAILALPEDLGPIRGVVRQDKSGEQPVDPMFHPGSGRPPVDPHRLILQGGPGDDEDPQEHWHGSCTRCTWSADSIGIQNVRRGVVEQFLAWHHIDPMHVDLAPEAAPQPRIAPRDRWLGCAVIVGAIVNIALAAWSILS